MTLSGGMAQRLMVARAIMHRPQVLFLDEPTAGLDPQSRMALWEILGELHDEGQTILLTTHYMEEADELCDRVAIMDHGRILALDTPAAVEGLDRCRSHRDRVGQWRSGGARRRARRRRRRGPPGPCRRWPHPSQCRHASAGLLPRIIDAAEAAGSSVHDLSVTEPTLESVFINLTGKDLRE